MHPSISLLFIVGLLSAATLQQQRQIHLTSQYHQVQSRPNIFTTARPNNSTNASPMLTLPNDTTIRRINGTLSTLDSKLNALLVLWTFIIVMCVVIIIAGCCKVMNNGASPH